MEDKAIVDLLGYGVEGVHYNMVDGKPRLTAEWQEKYEKDQNSLKKEGIGIYNVIRLNNYISAYGESTYGVDPNEDTAPAHRPPAPQRAPASTEFPGNGCLRQS